MGRIVPAANWAERGRSLVCPALVSLGVGVLAACSEPPPAAPPQAVAMRPPPPMAVLPPPRRTFPRPARKPTPPPENGAAAQPSDEAMAMAVPEPVPPSPQPPAPAAPAMSATKLIGLDQAAATSLLGAAAEQSSAPPATIWRYRNATCELDLFFYLDLRSGKMRTLHYAFKGGAANPEEREDCLQSLVIARRS